MPQIKYIVKEYLIKKMIRIYRRDKFELLKPLMRYVTAKWFLKRQFISIQDYATENPDQVTYLLQQEIDLSYSSMKFFNTTDDTSLKAEKGFEYAVRLDDVLAIGGSNLVVLSDKFVLYDLRFLDINNEFEYSDEAIKYYRNNQCILAANFANVTYDSGILLTGNYSINYYHLLLEIMVKFSTLVKLNIDRNIPLLVDEIITKVPQYVELLNYLNKENRKIISLKKGEIYPVARLYYISCPNLVPPNYLDVKQIVASSTMFNLSSIFYLRDQLLVKARPINFSKKIFISRKNASGRRKYNENEVFDLLKEYGFTICYPEDHSIAEQINIFNNAELIAGATGAAFTNILFCNERCKIICLTNYNFNLSIFSTIAQSIGVEMTYLFDRTLVVNDNSDLHAHFTINLDELKQVITQIN